MKKFVTLLSVLLLVCMTAMAQTRTVTGTVRDSTGKPIPFATINESGKKNTVTADADGNFSIKVTGSPKLVISAVGYKTVTTEASETSFSLSRSDGNMSEVVVTAMGIRRSRNTVPYSAQQISGDEVSQSRSNNFVSSLSGKVSGVEIRQGNGLGGSHQRGDQGNQIPAE